MIVYPEWFQAGNPPKVIKEPTPKKYVRVEFGKIDLEDGNTLPDLDQTKFKYYFDEIYHMGDEPNTYRLVAYTEEYVDNPNYAAEKVEYDNYLYRKTKYDGYLALYKEEERIKLLSKIEAKELAELARLKEKYEK